MCECSYVYEYLCDIPQKKEHRYDLAMTSLSIGSAKELLQ
jgi:hypothetical protein